MSVPDKAFEDLVRRVEKLKFRKAVHTVNAERAFWSMDLRLMEAWESFSVVLDAHLAKGAFTPPTLQFVAYASRQMSRAIALLFRAREL